MGAVVLIVLVGALGYAVVRLVRRRSAAAAPGTVPAEAGVPTFRVVALGARGSGKTLLLASMYHNLQVPSGRSYFMTAPYDQVTLLNTWFTEAADTERDWPAGTAVADVREFRFTFRTTAPSGTLHNIMDIGYLEYAGGLLTEPQAPGSTLQADLVRRIGTADALIGVIDGFRLRQWVDGRHEGQRRLQHTLTAMIRLMLEFTGPITFVITKWDLLTDVATDEDLRLRKVRDLLMSNSAFEHLVRTHSAQRVIRLIPVSAVGPSFATLDDAGNVTKLADGELRPTNVDAPLAAVLPDIFEQVERCVDKQKLQAELARVRSQVNNPAVALAELGKWVVGAAGRAMGSLSPLYAVFVGDAVTELIPGANSVTARMATDRRLSDTERAVQEYHLSRRRVMRDLQSRVDVLEGRLPSSRLGGQ